MKVKDLHTLLASHNIGVMEAFIAKDSRITELENEVKELNKKLEKIKMWTTEESDGDEMLWRFSDKEEPPEETEH